MNRPEGVTAFPLCWPEGWQRTPAHLRDNGSRFGQMRTSSSEYGSWRGKGDLTFDFARTSLCAELDRLGAKGLILSTNVPLRSDGMPRADAARARIDDPGVAIYFQYKGKPMVIARDAFVTVAANMRSLALAIEAMRQLERHGGGQMMERAFQGFTALPPPEGAVTKRPWWEVLQFPIDPAERALISADEVNARFRTLAKRRHSDKVGGDDAAMAELNMARADALAAVTAAEEPGG